MKFWKEKLSMSNQLVELQQQLENQLVIVKEMQIMKDDMTTMRDEIKQDVQELRDSITLTRSECREIQSKVQTRANQLTKQLFGKEVSDDLFILKSVHFRSIIYKRLKETLNIPRYYDIKRIDFKHAKQLIDMTRLDNLESYQKRLTPRQKEIAILNNDPVKKFLDDIA